VISSAASFLRSADLPRLVQLRADRQQRLTATDFRLPAVINEAALHRHLPGARRPGHRVPRLHALQRFPGEGTRDPPAHQRVRRCHLHSAQPDDSMRKIAEIAATFT
jgi:hypothetical protein